MCGIVFRFRILSWFGDVDPHFLKVFKSKIVLLVFWVKEPQLQMQGKSLLSCWFLSGAILCFLPYNKSKRSVRFILEKDDVPATAHVQIQYFVWWMINSIFWNIKECSWHIRNLGKKWVHNNVSEFHVIYWNRVHEVRLILIEFY